MLGEDLKEQFGTAGVELDVTEFVEQQQVDASVAGNELGEPFLVGCLGQFVHQLRAGHVAHRATLLARRHAEADQQVINFDVVRHWIAIHIGSVNETGPYYGFWSGFGSDISEFAIAAGLYTCVRKVNCHAWRCWRIGHHPLEGTPYHLCKMHHPDVPKGGAHIEDILAQYKKQQDAHSTTSSRAPTARKASAARKVPAEK